MSEKVDRPTPAELCLIAKEIFGAEDLGKADEQTDAILEKAMDLWVRASRFADRAPDEAKKLKIELDRRNIDAEVADRAHQKREEETTSLAKIAFEHFQHEDGRMLAKTIRRFVEGCSSDSFRLIAALKADKFDGNQEILVVDQHREGLKLAAYLRKTKADEKKQKKAQSSAERK